MTTETNTDVLNVNELTALATVLHAAKTNATVSWLNDNKDLLTGTARHLVLDPDNAYFLGDTDDVRDAYLRVSATWEYFLPVRDVVRMIQCGEFAVEGGE